MSDSTVPFIPGLQLNSAFYQEIVAPILAEHFPTLRHSAALIGTGSDVLGYDTPRSVDHNWGPRLKIFLSGADQNQYKDALDQILCQQLPPHFMGYSVHFSEPDWDDGGTQVVEEYVEGPVNHLLQIVTVKHFFHRTLDIDPEQELSPIDWLTFPEQKLLEVTSGKVFHDDLGLEAFRAKFAYFPHDVWLYRLAAQWTRISQEEAFMGRCGELGDELGSRIVAARLVRDIIRLAFLLERKYAPYSKWLGTAFQTLRISGQLTPLLEQVLAISPWTEREEPLTQAYTLLAEKHNQLGITEFVEPNITDFFGRPFKVLFAERFADAARQAISDDKIKQIPGAWGAVDQFVDSTDVTSSGAVSTRLSAIYQPYDTDQ